MPRRTVPLLSGLYYHVYNRGHNRGPIFFEQANYAFFLRQLRVYVAAKDARIVAYALMPNHYHLIVQAITDHLSHAMQLFGISYSKAINKRFARVGAIFQLSFRAKEIDRDEYLLHLSRYIHLNPVRANMVKRPQDWESSSYRDYIGMRNGSLPDQKLILQQFQSSENGLPTARRRYQAFVEDYMNANRDLIAHLLFDSESLAIAKRSRRLPKS